MVDFRLQLRLLLFQLCQLVGVGLDFGFDGFRLLQLGGVFFRLTHQHADLFA